MMHGEGENRANSTQENVLLIGVRISKEDRGGVEESLNELTRLTETAGGIVLDKTIQELKGVNPAYFIGKGKVEQVKDIISQSNVDIVVFDNDLTPAQQQNLETEFGVRILDRTGLILDFLKRKD